MSEQDTFEAELYKWTRLRGDTLGGKAILAAHHRAQVELLERLKANFVGRNYYQDPVEAIDTELNRLKGDSHE